MAQVRIWVFRILAPMLPVPIKKILVLLPVVVLGVFYFYDHSSAYSHVRGKRFIFLALSFALLYAWILGEVLSRRQSGYLAIGIQASYYVYIFMVLTLTGYFILFRELSGSGWWTKMMHRIDTKDHVNLHFFNIFKYYKIYNKQIVGNAVMLLPLGIFFRLLYRMSFVTAFFACVAVSIIIESLQLATKYRVADVDDILLNSAGALTGLIIFGIGSWMYRFLNRKLFRTTIPDRPLA